jgi:tetratricopeptide (TPR) repeat protein
MNVQARGSSVQFHNDAVKVSEQDPELAYRLLCSSVTIDPTNAVAWAAMGICLSKLGKLPASIAAFRRVLSIPYGPNHQHGDNSPKLQYTAMVNIAHQLKNDGAIYEAVDAGYQARDFFDENAEAIGEDQEWFLYTNQSQVLSIIDQTSMSIDYALRGWSLNPTSPEAELALALCYLWDGNYATGLRHFEARFAMEKGLKSFQNYPYPRWTGGHLDTLFIASEHGIGDTLSMARFVPRTTQFAKRVLFQVHAELHRMLTTAFRDWPSVSVIPATTMLPLSDAWCPVMGLPTVLGLTTEQIASHHQAWRMPDFPTTMPTGWKATDAKIHIGIAFGGSPGNGIDRWRSIPVTQFLDLYDVPGVQLYSLQIGPRAQDLHLSGCAALIRDLSPYIKDATDTVNIIKELDLVITIESFLGHLCGAMGKETWVAYSRRGGDWRIGRKEGPALWYPNHRIFRQEADFEWNPVFKRIAQALRARLGLPEV